MAEFCPGDWYLKDKETVEKWGFALTPVLWRKGDLEKRLERSEKLYSGEEKFELKETGEEGVQQIRALLGLGDLVTNVNIPNYGQIPNLPIGAVVETNACFRANSLNPVLDGVFNAFAADPNMCISVSDARKLFDEMVDNTKEYLKMYF